MLELKEGTNYLVMTKSGQIYFGEFIGCEMKPYLTSRGKYRRVDVFKNVCARSHRDNPLVYNYLHLLTRQVANAVPVEFSESKFLNMPRTQLTQCFENAIRRF